MDQKRFVKALMLRFFGSGLTVLMETYANAFFLSSYNKDKIPYLYLALAFFGFLAMQVLMPYVKHSFEKFIKTMNFILISFFLISIFFVAHSFAWFPFVAAIFILTSGTIIASTNTISVMNLFGLREFKAVGPWLSLSASLGIMTTGFSIYFLLKFFSFNILLYLNIAFAVALGIILSFIRYQPEPIVESRHAPPPIILRENPLFVYTTIVSLFVLFLYLFADYSLKSILSSKFGNAEIGKFLGPFTAITNLGVIVAQIFLLPMFLRRLGITGLQLITPIAYLILSIVILIYPNLWTVALLVGLGTVVRIGFASPGYQMLINAFAPAVRNVVQYQIQSITRLGMGFIALILILLTYIGALRLVALTLILTSIATCYFFLKIGAYYLEMLKKAVNLHRFNVDYLETEKIDEAVTLKIAEVALASQKKDVILYALSQLTHFHLKKVPKAVFEALYSESIEVKKMAIQVMRASKDRSVLDPLMKHLSEEKNPDVVWDLVNAILGFSPEYLLPYAIAAISNQEPGIKASAIRILLMSSDVQQAKLAKNELEKMLHNSDKVFRHWGLKVLKTGSVKDFKQDVMRLMDDPDEEVVYDSIFAARFYPDEEMINLLMKKREIKSLLPATGASLASMGKTAIPQILRYIHAERSPRQINVNLMLFSKFSDIESENVLLNFLKSENMASLETAIITLAYRSKQYSISDSARETVLVYALKELGKMQCLRTYLNFYQDEEILKEVQSRIYYAQKRYLYLLASYGEPTTILQIIPTLLLGDKSSRAYDSALEILEEYLPEKRLKQSIGKVFEEPVRSEVLNSELPELQDSWLKEVVSYKTNAERDRSKDAWIQKILFLRKVSLFKNLSAELLGDIEKIIQEKEFKASEILFQEGDIPDRLYIVVEGEIEIIRNASLINSCVAGGFLGELALLDESPRSAMARAKINSRVVFIEKWDFNRLTEETPEILKAITQSILTYLRR